MSCLQGKLKEICNSLSKQIDYEKLKTYIPKQAEPYFQQAEPYLEQTISYIDFGFDKITDHYKHVSTFEVLRDIVFALFVIKYVEKVYIYVYGYGIIRSIQNVYKCIAKTVMKKFLELPVIRGQVKGQLDKVLKTLDERMIDRSDGFYTELPENGLSEQEILGILDKNNNMKHTDWENGRVSGAVYHGGEDMINMQSEAYKRYSIANQLHPDVFPGVRKMESEVVSMVLNLYNGPDGSCGTSTSGGTESLLLTCLAARELAYHERGITEPEIIAPVTIHAGFDKAAYYFKMKLVHAPIDPITLKVDLKAVKRLINKNTVLLAGSAPNFPHGIIDDIEGLSKLAVKYKIPLHVDACLGSFIVPFLERAGFKDIPLFDFRVPGVTSISCDTHKYGFAPKGSSIIMYRSEKLRSYQYFVNSDWSGGLYASPTLAGSRPGALMVGCWASLMKIGINGYTAHCKDIVSTARSIKKSITDDIPELYIMGDPIGSVVAFSSTTLNIYDLSDIMAKKGWHLNALQNPHAIHIACTRLTVKVVNEFINDLKLSVKQLVKEGSSKAPDGTAALYGVAGSISTVGVADRIATGFLDNLYKV